MGFKFYNLDKFTKTTSTGSFGFGVIRNKLGIGTHQPDYDLDVAGTMGIANYMYHNGDEDTHLLFTDNLINLVAGGWSGFKIDKGNKWIRMNNTNQDLDFQVNADDGNIVLHSDAGTNRVGINTTTPEKALTVEGDISASGDIDIANEKRIRFANSAGHHSDNNSIRRASGGAIRFRYDDNTFIFDAVNDDTWEIKKSGDAPIFRVITTGAGTSFFSGSAGRFFNLEHSTGHIGIGAKNPTKPLQVTGVVSSSGDIYAGNSDSEGVVITSPDGTKYRINVANGGGLSTEEV